MSVEVGYSFALSVTGTAEDTACQKLWRPLEIGHCSHKKCPPLARKASNLLYYAIHEDAFLMVWRGLRDTG